MTGFRHIVLFSLRPGVAAADAIAILQPLGAQALEWAVVESLDTRKGLVVIQNGLFADQAAFKAFQNSPAHHEAGSKMREIADWVVADYQEA